jgi:peptide/nickel transport system substrate-binding protein
MAKFVTFSKKMLGVTVSCALAFSLIGAFSTPATAVTKAVAGAKCVNLNEQEYINNGVLVCKGTKTGPKKWTKAYTAGTGGEVTIGIGSLPPSLEAFAASAPPRSFVVAAIYSALTRVDLSTGTPIIKPNVADSWSQEKGVPENWIFNIIQGKKFPNGELVDAMAVKASIDWVMNPANKAGLRAKIADIRRVDVVSDYKVRIVTYAPRDLLPRVLGTIPILPPVAFAAQGATTFWRAPIATGPFIATKFTPNVELVLEPNPFSLRVVPAAKKVTFKVIPEDSSRMSGLRSGGLDVVNKVPTDDLAPLKSANFAIQAITEPATYHMSLMAKTGPLADKRVRQALNYAVNKQLLITGVNGGYGSIAQAQLVPGNLTGFCKDIKAYPFDLKKANDLMKAAGYTSTSKLNLTFQTSTAYITNDVLMAQAIAQMVEKLDAVEKVTVEVLEFSKFLDVYYLRGAIPRKDMFAWRMSSSPDLDAGVQMERYTSTYSTHNIGFANAKYDKFMEDALALKLGSPARTAAFCGAGKILKEEAPILWGIHTPDIWAGKKTIKRFLVDAGGNIDLVGIGK